MKTSFMAPARVGEMLECAAEVVSGGTRVAFVEAEVTDSTGRLLSRSSSTYLLTPREPSPS
jgi:acyl-coenzyme A thioesterase PaaI-like protein